MRRSVRARSGVDAHTTSKAKPPSLFSRLFNKEYVTVDDVPEQYKERFLTRGYRQPYSSFLDCLVSVCRPTNETLNVWTHLFPLLYLFHHFRTFPCQVWPLSQMDPHYYPLLAMHISTTATLMGSVIAHLFNCMTPRIRHTCFFLDYAAISVFSMGVACSAYYYLRPLNVFLFSFPNVYIGLSSLCNVLAVYLCCSSRHKWERSKYIIRTLAFALPILMGNIPSLYRLLNCAITGQECTDSLLYIACCCTTYLLVGLFNSSRFPERNFPSTFDICGHSHQWLHIFSAIGTAAHILGVESEIKVREEQLDTLLGGVTFSNSLGWTFGTLVVTLSMALWFGSKLTDEGNLRTASKG